MSNLTRSKGDWPEDFEHENGNYQRRCITCEGAFIGHKRRHQCKVCADKPQTPEDLRDDIWGRAVLSTVDINTAITILKKVVGMSRSIAPDPTGSPRSPECDHDWERGISDGRRVDFCEKCHLMRVTTSDEGKTP